MPSGMSSASAVGPEKERCITTAGCRSIGLVSDDRHAGSTVWSTAQPSGQLWKHAETQVSPLRNPTCVRVCLLVSLCKCCVVHVACVHTYNI